ncbi:hypothetical protein MY4038_002658 [Beauveria bassiana]
MRWNAILSSANPYEEAGNGAGNGAGKH